MTTIPSHHSKSAGRLTSSDDSGLSPVEDDDICQDVSSAVNLLVQCQCFGPAETDRKLEDIVGVENKVELLDWLNILGLGNQTDGLFNECNENVQALWWLVNVDEFDSQDEVVLLDRYALTLLFISTNGYGSR